MAKTIRDEQLVLNILVNGDKAKKHILDLEKSITDSKESLKNLKEEQSKFTKGSDDWKRLKTEIDNVKGSIKSQQSELAKARMEQSLMNASVDDLRKRIRLLRDTLSKTNPNTKEWQVYNDELRQSRNRLAELESQSKAMHGTICGLAEAAQKYWGPVLAGWKLIQQFSGQIEKAKQSWLDYDEALVDAMKTTGLSRSEMEELSEALKKFDTRTAQNELLSLAHVGGKLGISGKEDLLEFVSAADKINVALKEDLGGDAEAAIGQIGKLVDIFQLKDNLGLERAMLSVGSAINELGAASTANEGYIVNFTNRLAGIAPNAQISIDKILGLASALDANAQGAETAATAIGQTITAMFKKTETFAAIAKMPFEEFRDLLNNDVNGALIKVLEGMRGNNGLFDIVAAMDEMHLNGQRATTVLGALANNIDMLKSQQELANEAFAEGTSLTNEFNTKNESATAVLEKTKKALEEQWVELGHKLTPALNAATSATTGVVSIVNQAIALGIKYKAVLIAITAAYAAMNLATAAKIAFDKLRHFYSAQNKADLLMEASLLQGCTKATMLQCAAQNLLVGNLKGAAVAFKALGKAMLANPFGLIAAAVGALAAGIGTMIYKSREATKELRELNRKTVDTTTAFVRAQTEIDRNRKSLEELKDAATGAAEGSDERRAAIAKINELYGNYLPKLLTEKITNDELETALKNVNTQLENKIKLQARESAEMDIQQHKADAVKAALDGLGKRYEKLNGGQSMSAAQVGSVASSMSAYYDMPDTEHFIEMRDTIAGIFDETVENEDRQVNNIIALFSDAQQNGRKLRAMVDGLYGTQSSGSNATLGELAGGETNGNGTGTTSGGSTGGDDAAKIAAKAAEANATAMLKGLEQAEEEIDKESEALFQETLKRIEKDAEMKAQLVIDNEKDLTKKALLEEERRYEKERAKAGDNDELLELAEQKHRNRVEKIRLDSFDRSVSDLKSQHELERQEMVNAQTEELLAFKGTEKEKEALKKEHAKALAQFDLEYLTELQGMLQSVVDAGALEGMPVSLDDAELQKVRKQLAEIAAQMNEIKGGSSDSGDSSAGSKGKGKTHSIMEGTGKGELFGVSQDDWETLFSNLQEGKFQAEDLQTVISGIGGAAQEAFNLASQFSDLAKKKEDAALKTYKKNQDSRKNSLEKRLNAGLITESQYNAQVEQMDAEYDAYQEELAIKQAKREKALSITQAIISTALSITQTIAQWGLPWGLIPAAVAAAMGAAQIAVIASQPVTAGAEEGGFINVRREQDGKGFNARLNPSARGFVTQPTVIVGENGAEYVIPHEALENPTIAPVIASMETARRNGKLRSLNFNAIYPAAAMPGRASGGFISGNGGASGTAGTGSVSGDATSQSLTLAKALERLTKKLGEPITASVSMLGKGGIKETEEKYNRLKRRGQL